MSFPGFLLSQLYNVASSFRQLQATTGLDNFKKYLNQPQNQLIRLFVDGTTGRGHQSNSVRVLRKLAGQFRYGGTIEVAWRGKAKTLEDLQLLIPELHGGQQGQIGNATVKLVTYPIAATEPVVNVAFTGGADDGSRDENFATGLRATTFLRLQPYNWAGSPDQIQWDSSDWPYVDLRSQWVLGGGSFLRRAYSIPQPPQPNWADYVGGDYAAPVAILEWLTANVSRLGLDLCVTTGIRAEGAKAEIGRAYEVIFNLVAGLQASQRNGMSRAPGAKSVVVVNLDSLSGSYGDRQIDWARRLLQGGIGKDDQGWLKETVQTVCQQQVTKDVEEPAALNIMTAWQTRKQYLCRADVTAAARARLHRQGATLATIQGDVQNWLATTQDRVLFLPIGPVPPPVFDYVFSCSTMPTVFEGQSTANLALALGNPYFHVQRLAEQGNGGSQYPSTALGSNNFDQAAMDFQAAANRINVNASSWSPLNNPASDIGMFIKRFREENAAGPLHTYLTAVENLYAPPTSGQWAENDKFAMGVGFMNYVINGRKQPMLRGAAAGDVLLADEPPNPLPDLHTQLCANLHDGTLDLLPGVFANGEIFDFYKQLGLSTITVDSVTVDPACANSPDTIDKITISGSTDSWTTAGTTLQVELEFTAPQGEIVMTAMFSLDGSWSADGMPWVVLEKPFIQIETTQAALPAVGKVGGTIKGVGTFALTFPVEDGKWLFEGTYDPVLSPDRVFQLAGGTNLSSSLPAPVNGFATLGVSSTELLYDSAATTDKVEYVSVVISTAEPWKLLPGLSLDDLRIVVTVGQPTGRRELTADLRATFTIPGGTQSALVVAGAPSPPATIAVSASYPGGKLSGELTDGVITFDGLVGIFWPGIVPPLPALPSITGFGVEIDTRTKDYSLNCDLNIGWSITISGRALFKIESLSFYLECVKDSIVGRLVGTVVLGKAIAGDDVVIELSAAYADKPQKSWTFAGRQVSGVLYLDTLIERFLGQGWDTGGNGTLGIQDIAFEVETASGSYSLSGGTTTWKIEFLDDLQVSASLELHYKASANESPALTPAASTNGEVVVRPATELARLRDEADAGLSGKITAEIEYKFIDIQVYYAFAEKSAQSEFGFTWGILHGTVVKNAQQQWVGTLKLDAFSIGEMVETMVSWATGQPFGLVAPWTFLNDISLKGLELTFNFSTNEVGLDIDIGLDLGFAKIDKFTITYKPDEDQSVEVALDGSFLWVVDGGSPPPPGTTVTKDKVAWDATKPENTPAPSGGGNKYLDLRLLALGQHVSISGTAQFESVEDVMNALRDVKLPDNGCLVPIAENPPAHQLQYDPASSWLIAASFGVLKVDKKKNGESLVLDAGGER